MIRFLIHHRIFWLYVGMFIVAVAAILQTLISITAMSVLILVGLAIETVAVWPIVRAAKEWK